MGRLTGFRLEGVHSQSIQFRTRTGSSRALEFQEPNVSCQGLLLAPCWWRWRVAGSRRQGTHPEKGAGTAESRGQGQ